MVRISYTDCRRTQKKKWINKWNERVRHAVICFIIDTLLDLTEKRSCSTHFVKCHEVNSWWINKKKFELSTRSYVLLFNISLLSFLDNENIWKKKWTLKVHPNEKNDKQIVPWRRTLTRFSLLKWKTDEKKFKMKKYLIKENVYFKDL